MAGLADHLAAADPTTASPPINPSRWSDLIERIKSDGLEPALKAASISDDEAHFIRRETAICIHRIESAVIREVIVEGRRLQFSMLLPYLPQDNRFAVITTNYDRLIELAAEASGFLVDSKSIGSYIADFSPTAGAFAFARNVQKLQSGFRKIEQRVISLYKPHGSLDWVDCCGRAVRSAFDLGPNHALIVTPGRDKYRAGYDQPFDMHRELGNRAIDRAERLLIVGYGFNDDHLETHLKARILAGTQTLIMARTLTMNARALLATGRSVWALERPAETIIGTIVHNGDLTYYVPDSNLWDVEGFVTGVLGK